MFEVRAVCRGPARVGRGSMCKNGTTWVAGRVKRGMPPSGPDLLPFITGPRACRLACPLVTRSSSATIRLGFARRRFTVFVDTPQTGSIRRRGTDECLSMVVSYIGSLQICEGDSNEAGGRLTAIKCVLKTACSPICTDVHVAPNHCRDL